eukprot:TRINITY_DN3878_c0_g2_i1.p1 TRINITY_DN3878_c0_g2~~TRINITY_DN3878_c0_g2_i1.p1  ORF type:complete len:608 (-),score=98.45 TRINITY_DN3878_c0_g2_i1:133-1956(-)
MPKERRQIEKQISKRYHTNHLGGDIFLTAEEASDQAILWGEVFKDKEREFLRRFFEEELVGFASKDGTDTFQVNVKVAWQQQAKRVWKRIGRIPNGKVIMLLHGYTGRITSAWGWVKLVKPLWKLGYTVVAVDMPSFGRSSMNLRYHVPVSAWLDIDYVILAKVANCLGFNDTIRFVAYREACATVIRCWKHYPQTIDERNVFVDPVFSLENVLPVKIPVPCPEGWHEEKRHLQIDGLEFVLRKMKTWACFTGNESCASAKHALECVHQLHEGQGLRQFTLTEITPEYISEVTAGVSSPGELLMICKYMRDRFVNFLGGVEKNPPNEIPYWALEVCSTVASSLTASKSIPSLEDDDDDFATDNLLQEAADVLSRTGNRGVQRTPLPSLMGTSSSSRFDGRGDGAVQQMAMTSGSFTSSNLHQHMALTSGSFADSMGSSRLPAASGGMPSILKRPGRPPSKNSSGPTTRFGNTDGFQNWDDSESIGNRQVSGSRTPLETQGSRSLPALTMQSSQESVQRTPLGHRICRPNLPPADHKTKQAKMCTMFHTASKVFQRRAEDPQEAVMARTKQSRKVREAMETVYEECGPPQPSPDIRTLMAQYRKGQFP